MTTFETLLARHTGTVEESTYAAWQRAQDLFAERRYDDAAKALEELLTDTAAESAAGEHAPSTATGRAAARLLLARSYFHSAQLNRAIEVARSILEDDPGDAYARLLLSRALQRAGHHAEAAGHARVAEAMGVT